MQTSVLQGNTIAAQVTQDWITKEEFATELGMTVNSLNQYLLTGPKAMPPKFQMPGPAVCVKDPKNKMRNLYSPVYVEQVRAARDASPRSKASTQSSLKHAVLKITVPVFDKESADLLLAMFKDENGIDQFLRSKLAEVLKPKKAELKALTDDFESKKRALLMNV